ncbi:MAG: DUF3261 domain-containing protein [Deltaproteobacteria bacterium]|nr:DUF3261 domain-containing protein [Deltaproteobacteria bacterium]
MNINSYNNPSLAILLSMTIWWTGCAATTVNKNATKLRFHDDISVRYLFGAFDTYPSLVQQVVFQKGNTTLEFTAMVELKPDSMTMAGLSPLGARQFLMTVSKSNFAYEGQMLFDLPFPPQYLARDFLLTFAKADFLKRQIQGAQVDDTPKQRIVRYGNHTVHVTYSSRGFRTGEIQFSHETDGYSLQIQTVQVDFPGEMITSKDN